MPDLQPDVLDELERRLRLGLRAAAQEAPVYRGLPQPKPHPRRRRAGLVLAAACVTGLALGAVTVWFSGRNDEPPPAASCSGSLTFQGDEYVNGPELVRTPRQGGGLGNGSQAGCDDGNGAAPDRDLKIYAVDGVDSKQAVFADDVVWVREGAGLPRVLDGARAPVPCSVAGTVTVTGSWQGATPTKPVRFDGDLRAPYTIGLLVEDPAIVPRPYVSALLDVSVTTSTDAPGAKDVVQMLQKGAPAKVTLHCVGSGYVADSITSD